MAVTGIRHPASGTEQPATSNQHQLFIKFATNFSHSKIYYHENKPS